MSNIALRQNDRVSRPNELLRTIFEQTPFLGSIMGSGPMSGVDLAVKDDAYALWVDLPGYRKEDIQVKVYDNQLTISVEPREERASDEGVEWLMRQRVTGKHSRTIELPEAISDEGVQATFADGVLHLMLPKRHVSQARQITIQ